LIKLLIEEWKKLGFYAAQEVLNGGTKLMAEIKINLKNNESNKHFINQNIVCRTKASIYRC
jgi:hypothetical protein